jgi:hypothetical protein
MRVLDVADLVEDHPVQLSDGVPTLEPRAADHGRVEDDIVRE